MTLLTFSFIKPKFLVCMREYSAWVKNFFSVLHVQGLVIFQNHAHIQNLERSPGECMQTELSKFAIKRQESPFIFGTHKSGVFMASTSLDKMRSMQMPPVCFILCKQANLIERNVSGQAICFSECFAVQG